MADERDFRLRVDLIFPKEAAQYAEQIRDLLLPLYQNAVNIEPTDDDPNKHTEVSYIEVERCGHRLDPAQPCDIIARWEVGAGRVV